MRRPFVFPLSCDPFLRSSHRRHGWILTCPVPPAGLAFAIFYVFELLKSGTLSISHLPASALKFHIVDMDMKQELKRFGLRYDRKTQCIFCNDCKKVHFPVNPDTKGYKVHRQVHHGGTYKHDASSSAAGRLLSSLKLKNLRDLESPPNGSPPLATLPVMPLYSCRTCTFWTFLKTQATNHKHAMDAVNVQSFTNPKDGTHETMWWTVAGAAGGTAPGGNSSKARPLPVQADRPVIAPTRRQRHYISENEMFGLISRAIAQHKKSETVQVARLDLLQTMRSGKAGTQKILENLVDFRYVLFPVFDGGRWYILVACCKAGRLLYIDPDWRTDYRIIAFVGEFFRKHLNCDFGIIACPRPSFVAAGDVPQSGQFVLDFVNRFLHDPPAAVRAAEEDDAGFFSDSMPEVTSGAVSGDAAYAHGYTGGVGPASFSLIAIWRRLATVLTQTGGAAVQDAREADFSVRNTGRSQSCTASFETGQPDLLSASHDANGRLLPFAAMALTRERGEAK